MCVYICVHVCEHVFVYMCVYAHICMCAQSPEEGLSDPLELEPGSELQFSPRAASTLEAEPSL